MSSGIAAPIGGRSLRARALGHEGARELERKRLRRHLRVTTLHALENITVSGVDAGVLIAEAGDAAVELRGNLLRLGAAEPCELVTALEQVVLAAQRRGTVDVQMVIDLEGSVYGADAAALVGAVREALNNVHKHANASHVLVRCETSETGVRVVVSDDGVGVDLSHIEAGIGLRHSIVERMASRGGQAHVTSAPGHGMLVTLITGGPREVAA